MSLRCLPGISAASPAECAISTITSYELYTGVEKCADPRREATKVARLLQTVHTLPFDSVAAQRAAQTRAKLEFEGCPIGPYDVLLAGHAPAAGLILVTSNTAEFTRVAGLAIEDWRL